MKKISALIIVAVILLLPGHIYAQKELRGQIKEGRKEFREAKQDLRKDIKEKLQGKGIKIVNGEVTAVSDTSLTVLKDGKSYTVIIDSNTKVRRHFWGKSDLDEIVVGNHVNVFGRFTDDTQTTIQAIMIRNLSVQKRNGVFFGEIVSKGTDSFIMKTVNRGEQTVVVSALTKFIARNQTALTFADLQTGRKVRVRGLWDKSLHNVTEVTEVKDFSLPVKTNTPTP